MTDIVRVDLRKIVLNAAVIRELDGMTLPHLTAVYGQPFTQTDYHIGSGKWRPGDGRPPIAFDDDPASAQAAGRCVAARTRYRGDIERAVGGSIHPRPCGWCDYPTDVLLQALDHATWVSRYITAEYVWWAAGNTSYARPTGRSGQYDNPTWARFWALDPPLRRKAIEAAAAFEVPA